MPSSNVARRRRLGDATFAPLVTASTWANVYRAVWDRAIKARGQVTAASGWSGSPKDAPPGVLVRGTVAPRLSNAEAVQLIRGFHEAAAGRFALWYAYAAVAYGWDPPDVDTLDASATQGGRSYSNDVCVALWMELYRVARALDVDREPARLDLADEFTEPTFVANLRAQLQADGADALFKIPVPACRDKRTGKLRFPRPPCGTKDPITGKPFAKCDNPGDCDPASVEDPITYIAKQLWPFAAVLVAIWLFGKQQPRRRRRYEDN